MSTVTLLSQATSNGSTNALTAQPSRIPRMPPCRARWCGCLRLALVLKSDHGEWIEHGTQLFIPDGDLLWVSVQNIPPGHFLTALRRGTRLATLRRTTFRFGMPILGPNGIQEQYDVRPHLDLRDGDSSGAASSAGAKRGTRGPTDSLCSQTLVAVTNLMSKTGCAVQRQRPLNQPRFASRTRVSGGLRACLPRPYVGFADNVAPFLWESSTHQACGLGPRHFSRPLRQRFAEDAVRGLPVYSAHAGAVTKIAYPWSHRGIAGPSVLLESEGSRVNLHFHFGARLCVKTGDQVRIGDILAHEAPDLPEGLRNASVPRIWNRVARLFGREGLVELVRTWFERQIVRLCPGLVHAPADLVALSASRHAVPESLYWDVTPAIDNYEEGCEAFIFPPVWLPRWNSFRGRLPGEIAYDLMPKDPRFKERRRA
jgi:hypothetical protein